MKDGSNILDGKAIARKYLERYSAEIRSLKEKGARLCLATVRVGDLGDSAAYSRAIENLMGKIGVRSILRVFSEKIPQTELYKEIAALNADAAVTGILVFSPLPAHIHPTFVLHAVDILKDAEGRRVLETSGERVLSPTASACLALIEETGRNVQGNEAVVIGCSEIVGKPCAILLMDKRATVTVCHSKTRDLKAHVEKADIVIATAGRPGLVKGEWIKPGAIVVDVGENIVNGKIVGDVEFEPARERAAYITPVPGGVGPVTNVMLVKNLIALHKLRQASNGNY